MRKRNNRIWCRLSDNEYCSFQRNVERTGITQEAYLRKLIIGVQPKESPPLEYYQLLKMLDYISINMNQVAVKLHSTGIFESQTYTHSSKELIKIILSIQQAIE